METTLYTRQKYYFKNILSKLTTRINSKLYGGPAIKLIVNQTKQTFPMGTALQAYRY
jgi:hypothetical protein